MYNHQPQSFPQNYGQPPIMMNQHGYMAPPQQQTIIVIEGGDPQQPTIKNMAQFGSASRCPYCRDDTDNILNRHAGCVTFSWCVCLLFTTGVCCWVPFFFDGCKETDCICSRCMNIKTSVPANCC